MKTNKLAVLALAFLVPAVLATSGWGATVVVRSGDSLSAPGFAGQTATVQGKHGWRARSVAQDPRNPALPQLQQLALEGKTLGEAGTIEIVLVRDNVLEHETLFSFLDAQGRDVFSATLFWNAGSPTLVIASGPPQGAFLLNLVEAARRRGESVGGVDGLMPVIPLAKNVLPGQRLHLAFTWGPSPQECAIYQDGTRLDSIAENPDSMKDVLADAVSLVVGGEPWDVATPSSQANLIHSLVQAVRISNQALKPGEFLLSPVIRSVNHNAARVAGYSGFLVEGQELAVTLEAEAGGQATCEVGDIRDIPLAEDLGTPGRYSGVYTVKAGDFVEKGAVVGHFRNAAGLTADPIPAQRTASLDGRVHLAVKSSNELVPADRRSKVGITVGATDANGKKLRGRLVKLTLSTTDEYTGIAGSGKFADDVGGRVEVDWGGVTDSFGEVMAQYQAGFAAKTVVLNAKDMGSGDLGFGAIRSFIEGKVDITVKESSASRLMAMRGTLELSASRSWLTADGSSRSRITARVLSVDGKPVQGDQISFTLSGDRGQLKVIQGRTDSSGRAFADYIAGTVIGQVQVEVRDVTLGLTAVQAIELRADAPAEVILRAENQEVFVGGKGTAILVRVTDVNGNPNANTDVQFALAAGSGTLSAAKAVTDAKDGKASVNFTPGVKPGTSTVRATVVSRAPTDQELQVARGAIFLYGLAEDPGALTLKEWKAEAGDEVLKGQELAVLEDRRGKPYLVKAPRDGVLSVVNTEAGESALLGDTLAYVLPSAAE